MKCELEIITNITNQMGKVIVKNEKIKKIFDLDTIELEEYIDTKGRHIKRYSSIYHNNNYYKINKPYEELRFLVVNKRYPVVGLIGNSKKYK